MTSRRKVIFYRWSLPPGWSGTPMNREVYHFLNHAFKRAAETWDNPLTSGVEIVDYETGETLLKYDRVEEV